MLIKCQEWPKVVEFDDGIRPAGRPDECFYCQRRVGEPHSSDCVTVVQRVRYSVLMGKEKVGTLRDTNPHSWDIGSMEFQKNESSWCADNAMDQIEWVSADAKTRVEDELEKHACACALLEFEVEEIEDAGPFVEILSQEEFSSGRP